MGRRAGNGQRRAMRFASFWPKAMNRVSIPLEGGYHDSRDTLLNYLNYTCFSIYAGKERLRAAGGESANQMQRRFGVPSAKRRDKC